MQRSGNIILGFVLYGSGHGKSDWRHPEAVHRASINSEHYKRQAQTAERGLFDYLFVADSLSVNPESSPHYLSRFEPITILSFLAGQTSRIGLVGTLSTSFSEPFNVARQFASLDHISGGRCGWNVVTTLLQDAAQNFSQLEHRDHDERYLLAAEHLDVVRGLWDSWEAGAIVADKATGTFYDRAKLHYLNHKGSFFSVRGPLNVERSPQGQPVVFQAGMSASGKEFAARFAEILFTHHHTVEEAINHYADMKLLATRNGRHSESMKIVPQAQPVIGDTRAHAQRLYRELVALTSDEDLLAIYGRIFGNHKFETSDLDKPFPYNSLIKAGLAGHSSRVDCILLEGREENITLRESAIRHALPLEQFIGSPDDIAEQMIAQYRSFGCDGFTIVESLPGQLETFVDRVVPILQEEGVFRRRYDGDTLRSHLKLSEPANRYTATENPRVSYAGIGR